jgi:hypothetical protein
MNWIEGAAKQPNPHRFLTQPFSRPVKKVPDARRTRISRANLQKPKVENGRSKIAIFYSLSSLLNTY